MSVAVNPSKGAGSPHISHACLAPLILPVFDSQHRGTDCQGGAFRTYTGTTPPEAVPSSLASVITCPS